LQILPFSGFFQIQIGNPIPLPGHWFPNNGVLQTLAIPHFKMKKPPQPRDDWEGFWYGQGSGP
jgi:hypothetical protein